MGSLDRVARYCGMGLITGGFLAGLAVIAGLLTGETGLRSARLGVTIPIWMMALNYTLGGAWAGFVVGVALPLARKQFGAPLVGVIAALPVTFAITAQITPPEEEIFSGGFNFTWIGSAITLGVIGGMAISLATRPESSED